MTYKKVNKQIEKSAEKMLTEIKLAFGDLRKEVNAEFDRQGWSTWMTRINNGLPLHMNYRFYVRKQKRDNRPGIEISLEGKTNRKAKVFWIAGDRDTSMIKNHMMTLTDEQCDSLVGIKFKGAK